MPTETMTMRPGTVKPHLRPASLPPTAHRVVLLGTYYCCARNLYVFLPGICSMQYSAEGGTSIIFHNLDRVTHLILRVWLPSAFVVSKMHMSAFAPGVLCI